MLREIQDVKQSGEGAKRRWFYDDYFDLIIWYSKENRLIGFQLCYDKENSERALTWKQDIGYLHNKIDDGESMGGAGYKRTPILVPDGIFDYKAIADKFKIQSKELEKEIVEFVLSKILNYQ